MAQPATTRPVGADKDADRDDRGAEVALQHQEDEDAREHRRERDEYMLEVPHALGVAVDPVGDEDRERQLAELRRLKRAERSGVEPAPRAVDRHAQVRNQHEQHQQRRGHGAGGRERPDAAVVDAGENEQGDETDRQPRGLSLRVIEGRLMLRVGEGDARARHHDQAPGAQQHGGEQQLPVGLRPLRRLRSGHAANRWRTSSLNWLPRSSKSLNMSKLLKAGLRSTTLP